jgi:hypothetical protein
VNNDGCTCFICAPCSFCENLTEEEADIYCAAGLEALLKYRREQEDGPE